jgi:integrase/recombinase XerD
MLTLFRRLGRRCPHQTRKYRRCNCAIWVDGTIGGKEIPRTLKARNWQLAQRQIQKMEAEDKEPDERVTLETACQRFLQDAEARGLKAPRLEKYGPLFQRLKDFAGQKSLVYINQLDVDLLRQFRATWTAKNYTARNELERLRSLFRFAHEAKWIPENSAKQIKSPRIEETSSVPFSRDEMARISAACDAYETTLPLKSFVLLLRYSGLRIRDAVTLSRDKIEDGRLFLRTAKTGTHVRLPLPPACLEELAKIPEASGPYYFWSGFGKPKTRVANFQWVLKKMFIAAKVEHGHAHRFRHTLAVELLLAGAPIERVAVVLGHKNTSVTQKHYSSWVSARQEVGS